MNDIAALPRLDEVVIAELKEIMEEDFAMLLETWLQDAVDRVSAIDGSFADKNAEALREASHSFKGSCSNIGAARLSQLSAVVEQKARDGQIDGIEDLLQDLKSEYQAVKVLVEAEVSA
ncbi:MAG: Hpt domain-containing protein [Pseudomonadales bacterium]|nr:Hpt domain-containing protein [Pseudomonadales bacterium]